MRFGLLGQSRTILLGYFKSIRMSENKITSGLNENILRQDRKRYFSNFDIHGRIKLFIKEYCHSYKEYGEKYDNGYAGAQRKIESGFW